MQRRQIRTRNSRRSSHKQRHDLRLDGLVEAEHILEVAAEGVDERRIELAQFLETRDGEVDGGFLVDGGRAGGGETGGLEDAAEGIGGVEAGGEEGVGVEG